ncbi:hypothetical protein ACH41H_36300 [Streptomyces sp. NPDC020800]|uniref:hypothetical protein n=1 Tax=Streptomyces sp. NPDC020800 TaxID=3365092 RepID=UPI0037B97624
MIEAFTRGFRLLLPDGQHLDGAQFPSGRALVVDDPANGLATAATLLEHLLAGYHGARIEWPDEPTEAEPAREAWRVEYCRGDAWLPLRPTPDRQHAVDTLARRQDRHPDAEFRLVRVATTYAVEQP